MALLTVDRLAVYPRMVAVGMMIGWLVSQQLGPGHTDAASNVIGNDFLGFYAAAVLVAEDPAAPIYELSTMADVQHRVVPEMPPGRTIPYLNPPVALFLHRPFGSMPFGLALAVWWALGFAAWVGAHAVLRHALSGLRTWTTLDLVCASLLFPATLMWVFNGQATGLLMLLLSASFALLLSGREYLAGAVLGLLLFKPQIALGLALPMLFKLRWRALVGGVVSVGLQLGAAAVTWPAQFGGFAEQRARVLRVIVDPEYSVWGVESVYGFWHLLVGRLSAGLADGLTAASSLVVLALLAWGWRGVRWDPSDRRWRVAIAATLLAALPLGLHLYLYDVALFLLPFWILVDAFETGDATHGRLDEGPLLLGAVGISLLAFVGPYLAMGMLAATEAAGWPGVAVQALVPATLYAVWWLWRHRVAV